MHVCESAEQDVITGNRARLKQDWQGKNEARLTVQD